MTNKRCMNCRYCRVKDEKNLEYTCRINPPAGHYGFPIVSPLEWCSQFRDKSGLSEVELEFQRYEFVLEDIKKLVDTVLGYDLGYGKK